MSMYSRLIDPSEDFSQWGHPYPSHTFRLVRISANRERPDYDIIPYCVLRKNASWYLVMEQSGVHLRQGLPDNDNLYGVLSEALRAMIVVTTHHNRIWETQQELTRVLFNAIANRGQMEFPCGAIGPGDPCKCELSKDVEEENPNETP